MATKANKRRCWWLEDDAEEAGVMMRKRHLDIRASGEKRRELFRELAKAYGTDLRDATVAQMPTDRLSFNYARSYLDTWVSQLCKSRVLPQVQTTGGDYDAREKARGMNLMFGAEFERRSVFDLDPVWTRDSGLFGIAAAYICEEFGAPCIERVLPTELDFDAYEWRRGKGRTLYRTSPYDRFVLAEMYPDYEEEILMCKSSKLDDDGDVSTRTHDLVAVTMGWRLPTQPGADDGRYIVCIEGCTLEFGEYKEDEFPFAFYPRTRPVVGFVGDSIMVEMLSGQRELDRMTENSEESFNQLGVPRLWVKKGSANKAKLANSGGKPLAIFEVDSPNDIGVLNFDPISEMVLRWREDLIQKMAAVSTVSPMAAMGEQPTGITAASALQLLDDQESERKLIPQRNREQFYVQIARRLKRVVDGLTDYTILAQDGDQVVPIIPKDITLDDKELIYSVMPTNYAARTPAARRQQAQELMASNPNLPAAQVYKSLDIPELATFTRLETAVEDWITKECESILKGKTKDKNGDPLVPDPYMVLGDNGALALRIVKQHVAMANLNGAPRDRIDRLRQYGVAVKKQADDASKPPPDAALQPPAGPLPGMGGPLPPAGPQGMAVDPVTGISMPPQGQIP